MTQKNNFHNDLHQITYNNKQINILGTAHISSSSILNVREAIEELKPDVVLVELDDKRYDSLKNPDKWKQTNLKQVIREGKLPVLFSSLVLGSFQRRMGEQNGVKPGSELIEAIHTSERLNIKFDLIDREVGITLKRVWGLASFWSKAKLLGLLASSLFDKTEISEEELVKLRDKDTLSSLTDSMDDELPLARAVLLSERDEWMAQKIKQNAGQNILAVVGAAHAPGIKRILENNEETKTLEELGAQPPAALWVQLLGWVIPSALLVLLVILGLRSPELAGEGFLMYCLAMAIPSAIGAAIAMGHPLTILAAAIFSPITGLLPLLGIGMVTALVQVWVTPPETKDLENAAADIDKWQKWWSNKFLRVCLCFIIPSIGGAAGNFFGIGKLLHSVAQ